MGVSHLFPSPALHLSWPKHPDPNLSRCTGSGPSHIATPQKHLKVGESAQIEFQNCQGSGNVKLRYGLASNLSADHTLACSNVQFTGDHATCSFISARSGSFRLSTIDASKVETFSGPFTVDPAAFAPAVAQTVKGDTTGPHTKDVGADTGAVPTIKIPVTSAPVAAGGLKTESLGAVHRAEPMTGKSRGSDAGTAFARRALYDMTGFMTL
ncbi:hypothetical protein BGW39_000046 [Mortierella sp. 14UC]|nr:hypothetical protein BGW39_000046 [Mortierella sp. 14UC]